MYQPSVLAAALMAGPTSALTALYGQAVPGFLFGVGADGSGKHVYAVGSPVTQATYSSSGGGTVTWASAKYPTILYSGNGGISWRARPPPRGRTGFGGPGFAVGVLIRRRLGPTLPCRRASAGRCRRCRCLQAGARP